MLTRIRSEIGDPGRGAAAVGIAPHPTYPPKMRFSAFALVALVLLAAPTAAVAAPSRIADFASAEPEWAVVNDGVMGGVSESRFTQRRGIGTFSGTVRLENNGGFASVRSTPALAAVPADATSFDLRVLGDGRQYQFTWKRVRRGTGSRSHRRRGSGRRSPRRSTASSQSPGSVNRPPPLLCVQETCRVESASSSPTAEPSASPCSSTGSPSGSRRFVQTTRKNDSTGLRVSLVI